MRGASSRGRKRVVNVMTYQRVEILTGSERRRNYTPAEKVRIVEEAFRPGVIVKDVARRLGIHESLLYRWRRLMRAAAPTGGLPTFVPVMVTPEPDMAEPSALPSVTSPPVTPTAVAGAVLEVMLPDGAGSVETLGVPAKVSPLKPKPGLAPR